jgi:GTP cyclohydrolase II
MTDWTVTRMVAARVPTEFGEFDLYLYTNNQDEKEHLALVKGDVSGQSDITVRIHSECFTGDVMGSRRCDCGEQLHRAMSIINEVGRGVVVYLRQEGRGIGLLEKLRAYNLQDEGYDTVEANLLLGHQPDERDYTVAARILEDLNVRSILLLTNNPTKIEALKDLGIHITARVPMHTPIHADNVAYMKTKARRMHHLLDIESRSDRTPPPALNFS